MLEQTQPSSRALPARRALADDVYDAVLGLLMDRVIEPGAKASIDGIARELAVSPTPVREALVRLESEGLVTKRSLKGYAAADLLDAEGMRKLFEMRLLLEPAAIRLAASNPSDDFLSDLDALAFAMQSEAESAHFEDGTFNGYRSFQDHDANFHALIAAHSGNELLRDAFLRLRTHMHLFRFYFDQRIAIETAPEHNSIVDALRQGDTNGAERAMRSHLEHSFERMRVALSEPLVKEHVPAGAAHRQTR